MRRKVGEAVAGVLEPGETARHSVYLHVYGSPGSSILLGGLPVNIGTWILAVTDRRVLVFRGDLMDAARSRLVASYPRQAVTVEPHGGEGRPVRLTVSLGTDGSQRFSVPNIWRREAGELVAEMAGREDGPRQ
jgi:hypothetical protein